MGQVICCDPDGHNSPRGSRSRAWPTPSAQGSTQGSLGSFLGSWNQPDEATRRIEQLEFELRMLKEENFKVREEALRHRPGENAGYSRLYGQAGGNSTGLVGNGMVDPLGNPRLGGGLGGGGSLAGLGGGRCPGPRGGSFMDAAGRHGCGGGGGLGSMGGCGCGGGPDSGGRSGGGPRSVDLEQQLTYMRELVRSLQAENKRLKEQQNHLQPNRDAGAGYGPNGVDEAEYRRLQQKMMSLQQAHLNQLQEARQLQVKAGSLAVPHGQGSLSNSGHCSSFPGLTTTAGSGNSGPSTPGPGTATPGSQLHHLQSQYQTLLAEHETLRGKVRRLAHNR